MGKTLAFKGDTPTEKVVANSVTYPKRITIDTEKGIKTTSEVTFADVISLCLNAIVSNAFRVVDFTVVNESKAKAGEPATMPVEELAEYMESVRKNVTQYLYDQMNGAFTQALNTFAPDIALHPGLTELAILKAEDELIAQYFEQLPPDTLESAKAEAEKLFAQSRRRLLQKIADINAEQEALQFTPATEEEIREEERRRAVRIMKAHEEEEDSVSEEDLAWAKQYLIDNPLPCMTPAVEPEDTTSHWQEATKDGKDILICYHCGFEIEPDEVLPLVCPVCSREMVPTYEATPTKAELDDCGALCSQCEHDVCKKGN